MLPDRDPQGPRPTPAERLKDAQQAAGVLQDELTHLRDAHPGQVWAEELEGAVQALARARVHLARLWLIRELGPPAAWSCNRCNGIVYRGEAREELDRAMRAHRCAPDAAGRLPREAPRRG